MLHVALGRKACVYLGLGVLVLMTCHPSATRTEALPHSLNKRNATTTAGIGGRGLKTTVIPTIDDECYYNYRERRCEPIEYCQYKYRFLDATLGESCRLKGERKHLKPFYNSKITAHPGIIAAGATTLFAADIAAIVFTPLLQNFPITFNIIQGFILCLAGDTYFQVLEQGAFSVKKVGIKILEQGAFSVKKVGIKAWRTVRSGLIGALNNGLIHYLYYKWIDRRFPYHLFTEEKFGKPEGTYYKLSVAWFKYWIEWPTIGVYKIASMMILTAVMGGDMKGLPTKLKKRFMLTWLRSLQVWPIYDTILYAYVPASHRPLFNTFMSILWGGYLSHISQAEGEMDHLTEIIAAGTPTDVGAEGVNDGEKGFLIVDKDEDNEGEEKEGSGVEEVGVLNDEKNEGGLLEAEKEEEEEDMIGEVGKAEAVFEEILHHRAHAEKAKKQHRGHEL